MNTIRSIKANIPTWPDTLPPAPQLDGYNETHSSLTTSVTTGNKSLLIRRNSTRAQDRLNLTFMMNRKQVSYFEQFFYNTLAGGSLRFNFTHPRTLETIECSFDPTNDDSITITAQESMNLFKVEVVFIVWN